MGDFNNALMCFKPASLHGIKLHQGSDLTWQDVGGLDDIKQTLKETLEWPAKVKLRVDNQSSVIFLVRQMRHSIFQQG